jgi:hypothetical protein
VATKRERTWSLNSFLDSLILELDRAQDILAVKGINRRLTYTVENLALELHLFPEFDGGEIRFATARPGETGAAKISFNLGSITDRQIKEVTNEPLTAEDVAITDVEGLDDEARSTLRKIGVTSTKDIERMQRKNIDLGKVSENKVDYTRLANVINRAKRRVNAPTVARASLSMDAEGSPVLAIEGNNLATASAVGDFPLAFLNDRPVPVLSASSQELRLSVTPEQVGGRRNELRVLLDPFAVMTMELRV